VLPLASVDNQYISRAAHLSKSQKMTHDIRMNRLMKLQFKSNAVYDVIKSFCPAALFVTAFAASHFVQSQTAENKKITTSKANRINDIPVL
jgi:hypothetical protein